MEALAPVTLKDENFIQRLKILQPDLFVIVAFRILPKEVYTIPTRGAFNLHASLLPKFRGAAPIQWSLINGEKETGVTTFFLEEKVDTGNIIIQEKILIDDSDDYGSLHDKMMFLGADVVLKTVDMIDKEKVITKKQDDSLASPAQKITKEICQISWSKSAEEIHNLVRGLSPHPGASFEYNGKTYKVFKSKINIDQLEQNIHFTNHRLLTAERILQSKTEIFIRTIKGNLQILELQHEGRKRMTAEEFLRGYSLIN